MASFFDMVRTLLFCGTLLAIASVVSLSLPKSRLRTVLSEICSWAFLALCTFYAVSPIDVVPEALFGPFGFVDDLGAIFLGYQSLKSALQARRERKLDYFD